MNLKSNMDRFIANLHENFSHADSDLKSNMDRFIERKEFENACEYCI